jgi:hypothetical protein
MSIVTAQQQKSGTAEEVRQSMAASTDELIAFCPKCGTFETLWFKGDVLMQTLKFVQKDTGVYHDCGSNEPCRLLPRFLKT